MKKILKQAFTLTEVLITLTVIGVLSMILIPVALHSMPDENVMKFKKADAKLYDVINQLVTTDKYYCNGDLGLKADCETLVNVYTGSFGYFCNSIADLLSTKYVRCRNQSFSIGDINGVIGQIILTNQDINQIHLFTPPAKLEVTQESILATKNTLDRSCKVIGTLIEGPDIITTDGIQYYTPGTVSQIGTLIDGVRAFSPPGQFPANISDQNGFDIAYLTFCVDIDGIPDNATQDDCINECPFGYGIRADGKIMRGARAEEWMNKSVERKD